VTGSTGVDGTSNTNTNDPGQTDDSTKASQEAKNPVVTRQWPVGLVLVAVGLAVFVISGTFHGVGGTTYQLSPELVPRTVAVLLLATGIAIALSKRQVPVKTHEKRGDWRRVTGSMLAIAVFIYMMQPLGFIIASTIYLLVQGFILKPPGRRYLLYVVATAALIPLPVYLAFVRGLDVRLPAGLFG